MLSNSPWNSGRLSVATRMLLFSFGATPLLLLCVAGALEPNPRGLGTHQKLGLPPCTMRVIAGIRCPSCGMTTSWSWFARGHVVRSFQTNAGGALLALFSVVFGPWSMISATLGHWWLRTPSDWLAVYLCLVITAVTLVDWAIRINMDRGGFW